MIALAIKLALGRLTGAFRWLADLVGRYPLSFACAAFILALAWTWNAKTTAERERDEAVTAYQENVKRYLTAQAEAEAAEKARLARVRAEQERITNAVSSDYRQRLADARARYDRLRAQADRGAPARVNVPGVSQATGGTDASASDPGFSLGARLVASEQAEQLVALQEWVREQAAVSVE